MNYSQHEIQREEKAAKGSAEGWALEREDCGIKFVSLFPNVRTRLSFNFFTCKVRIIVKQKL